MDKETLSNYGWIVICVLVLAVMIALASPFGSYVASAVENTTQGLFDAEQNALDAAGIKIADQSFEGGSESATPSPEELIAQGIVPEGATYFSVADEKVYNAGDTMPIVAKDDIFKYGDYEYVYSVLTDAWGVNVINFNKSEYGAILECVDGKPVSLSGTFMYSTNITTAPTIPSSVTNIDMIFCNCLKLTEVTYQGTISQWNALYKSDWNSESGIKVVHCSDGDIEI